MLKLMTARWGPNVSTYRHFFHHKQNAKQRVQILMILHLGLPTVFGPCVPRPGLCLPGTQNVPYFRMHVKQICGVGNKLIIRLQTHHTVSLVRYASSIFLEVSWGKLVCFHATTILLLTYSWIGTSVTSWTLRHHLVLFTAPYCLLIMSPQETG